MRTTLIAAGAVLLGQADSANYSYSELSHRGGFTGGARGHVPRAPLTTANIHN